VIITVVLASLFPLLVELAMRFPPDHFSVQKSRFDVSDDYASPINLCFQPEHTGKFALGIAPVFASQSFDPRDYKGLDQVEVRASFAIFESFDKDSC